MNPQDVQKVIDQLFALLESKVSNPWLLDLIKGVNSTADNLVDTIANSISSQPVTQQVRAKKPYPRLGLFGPHDLSQFADHELVLKAEALQIPWLQVVNALITGGLSALEQLIATFVK